MTLTHRARMTAYVLSPALLVSLALLSILLWLLFPVNGHEGTIATYANYNFGVLGWCRGKLCYRETGYSPYEIIRENEGWDYWDSYYADDQMVKHRWGMHTTREDLKITTKLLVTSLVAMLALELAQVLSLTYFLCHLPHKQGNTEIDEAGAGVMKPKRFPALPPSLKLVCKAVAMLVLNFAVLVLGGLAFGNILHLLDMPPLSGNGSPALVGTVFGLSVIEMAAILALAVIWISEYAGCKIKREELEIEVQSCADGKSIELARFGDDIVEE